MVDTPNNKFRSDNSNPFNKRQTVWWLIHFRDNIHAFRRRGVRDMAMACMAHGSWRAALLIRNASDMSHLNSRYRAASKYTVVYATTKAFSRACPHELTNIRYHLSMPETYANAFLRVPACALA